MLTREKVEHGLRAAAEVLQTDELVLIGSATAIFQDGRYTARMALSDEIDTYGDTTRVVRSCTTRKNDWGTFGSRDHAAALDFPPAARSGRKVPLGWGCRIQS